MKGLKKVMFFVNLNEFCHPETCGSRADKRG